MNGEWIMDNLDPFNFATEQDYFEFWEKVEKEEKERKENGTT